MKSSSVDVMIYMPSNDAKDSATGVIGKLGQAAGVISVTAHSRINSLLAVKYAPHSISAKEVLNVVRQQGCAATLVGM